MFEFRQYFLSFALSVAQMHESFDGKDRGAFQTVVLAHSLDTP